MWRAIKCTLRQAYNNFHYSRLMSTKPTNLQKNVNIARMVGTISSDVFSSEVSKTRLFFLRTFNQDHFYDTHKIVVPAYVMEKLPGIPKTGQKLIVTGKLRTGYFTQNGGKRGTYMQIMAKQIYLCDNGDAKEAKQTEAYEDSNVIFENNKLSRTHGAANFDIKDQNHVEIMAQICFDIINEDSYSYFNLALHYLSKNSDGLEEEQTDFITVFAYNESLRNIVRTQLKRLDRVRVEGTLKYKACIDSAGKKQYKCYIEANKIAKLITLRPMIRDAVNVKAQNT
ncbi:uncharacterized protein LOC129570105 [Sitodiplosis mosellana]|uniref:uncharacterized protein LOC129570105 n=1 Tax=Sitodiplosis mosellana TaxID=263140 RepID=UPI0024439FB1|nr:uncharacterized protein LOC129570105 [Sitodiplosis mosellana]